MSGQGGGPPRHASSAAPRIPAGPAQTAHEDALHSAQMPHNASEHASGVNNQHPRTGSVAAVRMSARRAPAIWAILAGIVASTLIAVLTTARIGAGALAVLLFAAGAIRLCRPSRPGPVGLAIRSRAVDVTFYWLLAGGIALLALTAPGI